MHKRVSIKKIFFTLFLTIATIGAVGVFFAEYNFLGSVTEVLGQPLSADESFQSRCTASGVILCQGFDDLADFDDAIYPAGDGSIRATLDTTVKASGNGSLQFEIPGLTSANTSGYWDKILPQAFAEGDTFYVQFRQRFTPEMFNNMSGLGWKQLILSNRSASCANIEIATVNGYYGGYPSMYDRCGYGFQKDIGNFDRLLQHSEDWPSNPHPNEWVECHSQNIKPPPEGGCFFYKANDWMVFYYKVHIGTWGQPNSYVKAWVGYEGEELHMFMNNDPWTAYPNDSENLSSSVNSYNRLILLVYDTRKDPTFDHPTAYTWYDELIVSTEPIAAPFGETPIVTTPASITTQPQNQNVAEGSTATFTVTATGASPLTYQWKKSGTDISGANSASYTTQPTTQSDNNSSFTVTVTNTYGTDSSNTATLTVGTPVLTTITIIPSLTSVRPGGTVQFSATGKDQFGNIMRVTLAWSVTGGGDINNTSGLFTAQTTEGGPFTVTAQDQGKSGEATVSVSELPQPIAHWPFDETSGTSARDATGNGNTGAINGTTWTTGKIGGALDFDGSNDYVDMGDADATEGLSAITISAWVKPNAITSYDTIAVKGTSSGDFVWFFALGTSYGSPNGISFQIRGVRGASFNSPSPVGVWQHLLVTWDGDTMRGYRNGIEIGNFSASGTMNGNSTPLNIGHYAVITVTLAVPFTVPSRALTVCGLPIAEVAVNKPFVSIVPPPPTFQVGFTVITPAY